MCAFVFYRAGMDINYKKTKSRPKRPKTSTRLERTLKPRPRTRKSQKVYPEPEKIKPDKPISDMKPKINETQDSQAGSSPSQGNKPETKTKTHKPNKKPK